MKLSSIFIRKITDVQIVYTKKKDVGFPMSKPIRNTSGFIFLVSIVIAASVLAHPGSGIEIDRLGQIYFLDTGSGLWKLDTLGKLTHLSRFRYHWLALDEINRFASTRLSSSLGDVSKSGTNPTALISSDYPVAIGKDGNFYYPFYSGGKVQMKQVLPSGETTVLVTLPDSSTWHWQHLSYINGLAAGPDSSLYYTEHNGIRKISKDGRVSVYVIVAALVNGPSIPGVEQRPYLRDLDVDSKGVIYVADNGDARVLKITPDLEITTLFQTQSPWAPTAIAVYKDDVYVLEFSHTEGDDRTMWMPRIRKITPDGKSTIILTVDQMPGAR